jgi:methionine-rich copper-binding protein CopC
MRAWFRLLVASASFVGSADAHARLVTSDPPDGAVLVAPPTTITLHFDGEMEPALGTFVLAAPAGDRPLEPAPIVPADRRTLAATLPVLAAGRWRVTWRAVSRDGHAVTGKLDFVVAP